MIRNPYVHSISAKISSTNSWLTCFFTETRSIKKSDLQPIPPNVSPWPQEAQSINEVMVGRHCSDTPLTSTPRRSEVVRKKRKRKAKVSCYLPSENQGLPEPRQVWKQHLCLTPGRRWHHKQCLTTLWPLSVPFWLLTLLSCFVIIIVNGISILIKFSLFIH